MNTSVTILFATVLAWLAFGALGADDAVKNVKKQAKATYQADKNACKPLGKDERKDCERRAKAQYGQAMAEARKMERDEKQQKAAQRAEEKDRKQHASVHSGGDRSYKESERKSEQQPAPGAR